jgi:hypothetical protein
VSTPRTAIPHDIDLSEARWRKSSYSGGANDCVEVADLGSRVAVRDSKYMGPGPLVVDRSAMCALISGVASGVF